MSTNTNLKRLMKPSDGEISRAMIDWMTVVIGKDDPAKFDSQEEATAKLIESAWFLGICYYRAACLRIVKMPEEEQLPAKRGLESEVSKFHTAIFVQNAPEG